MIIRAKTRGMFDRTILNGRQYYYGGSFDENRGRGSFEDNMGGGLICHPESFCGWNSAIRNFFFLVHTMHQKDMVGQCCALYLKVCHIRII